MLSFIKKRLGKVANRLFLHDKELAETVFKPGTHYRYMVDLSSKKLIILPADQGNTVSTREIRDGNTIPLIDIRRKSALSAFKGCEYLQITIYREQVIVQGFIKSESAESIVPSTNEQKEKAKSAVRDIRELISVRQHAEIVLSLNELQRAAGFEYGISETFNAEEFHLVPGVRAALKKVETPLKVLSLFSGAGLMDLGFIKEGFDIVFAIDNNPWACKTYRHNIGDHIHCGDIKELQNIPDVPIIIGGSPCQGFSNANRHSNFLDNPKNLLVKEYIRVVKSNPATQVFVLENVPQLLSAGEGAFLREIKQQLEEFDITAGVLTATDYGTAQSRKRTFIIGSKIGKIKLPSALQKPMRTVREAFQGLQNNFPNQKDYTQPKAETLARIKQVPEGGNWRDVPELKRTDHHSSYLRRLAWDEPAVTLPNVRKTLLLHPEENRIISVRESARLFDVPDDFEFLGSLDEKQQMVGNGVPVNLAQAVARQVKAAIAPAKQKVIPLFADWNGQLAFKF